MHINASLNLAFPISYVDAETIDPKDPEKKITVRTPVMWAYHTPISMEVFDGNYRVFAAAKQAIFGKGISYAFESGLRVARLELLDAAEADAAERGLEQSAGPALIAELRRLTSILAPGKDGFDLIPSDLAVSRGVIDKEDFAEVESAIIFFTCAYAMARRNQRADVAQRMVLVLGGSITSSNPTEFAASLKTSTPGATSEASIPSSQPS